MPSLRRSTTAAAVALVAAMALSGATGAQQARGSCVATVAYKRTSYLGSGASFISRAAAGATTLTKKAAIPGCNDVVGQCVDPQPDTPATIYRLAAISPKLPVGMLAPTGGASPKARLHVFTANGRCQNWAGRVMKHHKSRLIYCLRWRTAHAS